MDWRHEALCRNEDPELFFAAGSSGPAADQITEAKAVCLVCPVRSACLDLALRNGLDHGVFGGMSEEERRALKKQRTAATSRTR